MSGFADVVISEVGEPSWKSGKVLLESLLYMYPETEYEKKEKNRRRP